MTEVNIEHVYSLFDTPRGPLIALFAVLQNVIVGTTENTLLSSADDHLRKVAEKQITRLFIAFVFCFFCQSSQSEKGKICRIEWGNVSPYSRLVQIELCV